MSWHPRCTVFDDQSVADAMEKARGFVEEVTTGEVADEVSRLSFPPHRPFFDSSFYEFFAIRGVRLTALHSDIISCSFKVPPRLIDRNGNLAMGAITSLIDVLGAAVAYRGSQSRNVSVDMSISCISAAKLDDMRCCNSKNIVY